MLVALDLSAAFDTIGYLTLCDALQHNYGIGGTVLTWMRSYLQDMQLQVQVKDATLTVKTI